jgi:site-specific recombinase XerD
MAEPWCAFLDYLRARDAAAGTISNYRNALQHFFTWFTETTRQAPDPALVTSFDLRQYREALKARYKPGTINRRLANLSSYFRWCVTEGTAAADPVERIRRVSEQRSPRWLSKQEVYQLLRLCRQRVQIAQLRALSPTLTLAIRNQAIVLILLSTGLRVSELCDLQMADIRLSEKAGLITVRWGKGNKRRQIPLNSDGRRALREWLKIRESRTQYVFTTSAGRMSRQLVQIHLSQLGRAIHIQLSPHLLRHTFGKSLVDAGESLDRVAQLMGHSDVNTTAIYTMASQVDLQRAVDKISWED